MAVAPLPIVQGKVLGNADPECPGAHPAPPSACPPYTHGSAAGVTAGVTEPPRASLEVLQLSCRDVDLPPEIRLSFIKKVYGILGFMLLITFGLSAPFIFLTEATMAFFRQNMWILYIVGGIVIAQIVFDLAMSCQMCCGSTGLLQGYLWMMKTAPWNYLYLTIFSACFGVLVGFICAQYTVKSVLLIFGLTFVLIVALTIYAVWTKADFTGCGAYILVSLSGVTLLMMVYFLFPGSVVLSKIVAGVGAILFGFLIVYDTQQIFGSASATLGGGRREVEYTLDMYALAAWNLYLDFLNFFLYLLQLFGERR